MLSAYVGYLTKYHPYEYYALTPFVRELHAKKINDRAIHRAEGIHK